MLWYNDFVGVKMAKLVVEVKGADHFCRREQDVERITNLFLDIL